MRRYRIAALLALVGLAACAGGNDADPYEGLQDVPQPSDGPRLIAEVEHEGEVISFHEVILTEAEEGEEVDPLARTVVMMRNGQVGTASVYDRMSNDAQAPVTFAELFIALAGEAPERLRYHHEVSTRILGRTTDYLDTAIGEQWADGEVEKRWRIPQDDALLTAPIPLHHYEKEGFGNKAFNCFDRRAGAPNRFTCSVQPPLPDPFVFHGCSGNRFDSESARSGREIRWEEATAESCSTKVGGWKRLGVINISDADSTPSSFTVQASYGPSTNGAWASFQPTTLRVDRYLTIEWITTATQKTAMGWTVQGIKAPRQRVARFMYAEIVRD